MSGFEFARLARSIQPGLPVIYVTGVADTLGRDRVPSDDPIVMKPYSRATLLKVVHERALRLIAPA
jgi:two-component SAPR family response regulator